MPSKKYILKAKPKSKLKYPKLKSKSKHPKSKFKLKTKTKIKSKSKSKTKTKHKSKTKSKSHSKSKSQPKYKLHDHQSLLDIIKQLSVARNNISKSQNNLPAHLIKMNKIQKKNTNKNTNIFPNMVNKSVSKSFSKSSSSSYSSIMKNGKTKIHSEGKEILNNSNNPFIEIKEMDNGTVTHYMVPKNTIPYKPIGYKMTF